MAQIDHSIYSRVQAPDIIGGVERGLSMADMLNKRKKAADLKSVYQNSTTVGPDGKMTFDGRTAISELAGLGYGQEATELENQIAAREANMQKMQAAAQQSQFEQQWKDREFQLREQELKSRALDRQEARSERRFQAGVKQEEKMQGLQTPYGLANTVDDAKQLKQGHESKKNFDAKIQEMINLRKQYGTEYLNREAVARGQQLSKDLLLEYKNMAKLGVLSQADEAIINAIIPPDPLAQDWAPGQDPILSNLTKFKSDSDRDFQTRVATRTRAGVNTGAIQPPGAPPQAPRHGTVVDGYVFMGGNPADQKNWKRR